jgi:hypothetical protein
LTRQRKPVQQRAHDDDVSGEKIAAAAS